MVLRRFTVGYVDGCWMHVAIPDFGQIFMVGGVGTAEVERVQLFDAVMYTRGFTHRHHLRIS